MIPLIEEKRAEIEALCRRYHVATLEVFGSAATGAFDPLTSDFDFLVTFHDASEMDRVEQYFGLLESLRGLFRRHVDLVVARDFGNRYFRDTVNESRQSLYAA